MDKKIRIISLVTDTAEELDAKANALFAKAEAMPAVSDIKVGQTYRTYESRANKGAKSFINTPFFTNSITVTFKNEADEAPITTERVDALLHVLINDEEDSTN